MGKPVGSRFGWMVRKIQFLLPKNGRESLELVSKMGFNEWYSNFSLEYRKIPKISPSMYKHLH